MKSVSKCTRLTRRATSRIPTASMGGRVSLQLFRLGTEVRYTPTILDARESVPSPTCGDIFGRADEAHLPL